jgi:hypothetical protein
LADGHSNEIIPQKLAAVRARQVALAEIGPDKEKSSRRTHWLVHDYQGLLDEVRLYDAASDVSAL